MDVPARGGVEETLISSSIHLRHIPTFDPIVSIAPNIFPSLEPPIAPKLQDNTRSACTPKVRQLSSKNELPQNNCRNASEYLRLPDDIMTLIFTFLSGVELVRLQRLNIAWYRKSKKHGGVIEQEVERRWIRQFSRMLKRTAQDLSDISFMEFIEGPSLTTLHEDTSYSSLLYRNIQGASTQAPILREALEERLFQLYQRLSITYASEADIEMNSSSDESVTDDYPAFRMMGLRLRKSHVLRAEALKREILCSDSEEENDSVIVAKACTTTTTASQHRPDSLPPLASHQISPTAVYPSYHTATSYIWNSTGCLKSAFMSTAYSSTSCKSSDLVSRPLYATLYRPSTSPASSSLSKSLLQRFSMTESQRRSQRNKASARQNGASGDCVAISSGGDHEIASLRSSSVELERIVLFARTNCRLYMTLYRAAHMIILIMVSPYVRRINQRTV